MSAKFCLNVIELFDIEELLLNGSVGDDLSGESVIVVDLRLTVTISHLK
jgi:hypothetical protein